MSSLPFTGWPKNVFPSLVSVVSQIVENPNIREFYIGRGVDISDRSSAHGSDDVVPLYETNTYKNAILVEESLIQRFILHPKCNNKAPHGGGGTSESYKSYVYIALWF